MSAKQELNDYIQKHPDFWEYQSEMNEVERLKTLCEIELVDSVVSELELC